MLDPRQPSRAVAHAQVAPAVRACRRDAPEGFRAPGVAGLLLAAFFAAIGLVAITLVSGGGLLPAAVAYSSGGSLILLSAGAAAALRPSRPRQAKIALASAGYAFVQAVRRG